MGREITAVCTWKGKRAEAKVLLESQELILRGALRARIPRSTISDVRVTGERLSLKADGHALVLDLGKAEAEKWKEALLKALPSLASKLGIAPEKPVFVIGKVEDPELAAAIEGATAAAPKQAAQVLAVLTSSADLDKILKVAEVAPRPPVWCVYAKGKDADPGDAEVRAFLRGHGYMDNKSCAVSARLTATRYAPRG